MVWRKDKEEELFYHHHHHQQTEPYRTERPDPVYRKMETHSQRFHHHQDITERLSEEDGQNKSMCRHGNHKPDSDRLIGALQADLSHLCAKLL